MNFYKYLLKFVINRHKGLIVFMLKYCNQNVHFIILTELKNKRFKFIAFFNNIDIFILVIFMLKININNKSYTPKHKIIPKNKFIQNK